MGKGQWEKSPASLPGGWYCLVRVEQKEKGEALSLSKALFSDVFYTHNYPWEKHGLY